jgi:TRAP-type C4-dicarboxylate transport system permease small subunit
MRFLLRDAEKIICAALFLAMTFLGFANVFVRYATHMSLASSEELLTNGFLILTVFGAALAARRGEHLAVTVVHESLPSALWRPVFLLSAVLSVFLLAMSAWFACAPTRSASRLGIIRWRCRSALRSSSCAIFSMPSRS